MPDVTSSIVISHPVTVVWDYISQPDNLYTIIPGVVSAATGAVTAVGKLATDTVSGAVKTAVATACSSEIS